MRELVRNDGASVKLPGRQPPPMSCNFLDIGSHRTLKNNKFSGHTHSIFSTVVASTWIVVCDTGQNIHEQTPCYTVYNEAIRGDRPSLAMTHM